MYVAEPGVIDTVMVRQRIFLGHGSDLLGYEAVAIQEMLTHAFLADASQFTNDECFLRRELDDLRELQKITKLDHSRVVALLHHDRQWCDDNELPRHDLRASFGAARVVFYRHEPPLKGSQVSD